MSFFSLYTYCTVTYVTVSRDVSGDDDNLILLFFAFAFFVSVFVSLYVFAFYVQFSTFIFITVLAGQLQHDNIFLAVIYLKFMISRFFANHNHLLVCIIQPAISYS